MGYKVYRVNEQDALAIRSNTDGYQPKFVVDNGLNFIKVQCEMSKTLRDDWRVEDIASRICEQLGIYALKQTPCKVVITSKKGVQINRLGVISRNFEVDGYKFVSYNSILKNTGHTNQDKSFIRRSCMEKVAYIIDIISLFTSINKNDVAIYILNMMLIDLLVLNQDRHFSNFGVFFNERTNKYEIAMIFDCGMGLFENDPAFDDMNSLEQCLRYSYVAPYGEDPFDLARELKNTNIGYKYLKAINVSRININKNLFIHDNSYEYFTRIKKELEV
jgi:hypothetical protein